MDTHQDDEWVSKTAKKKQMNELQDLGMELTRLSHDTLKKIGLPEELAEAVREYRKITSNGALKRQSQFIGRLMRDIDPAPIRAFLSALKGENQAHNAFLRRAPGSRRRRAAHPDPQHAQRAGAVQAAEKLPRAVSGTETADAA